MCRHRQEQFLYEGFEIRNLFNFNNENLNEQNLAKITSELDGEPEPN